MMHEAFAVASEDGAAARLAGVLRRAPLVMVALAVAREVDAPDWLIAAGAIRDAVWDDRHGRRLTVAPRDVDVCYFDPSDLAPERDRAVERELRARAPHLPWQATNQVAVHLWYLRAYGIEVAPLRSCAESVATFPETATCVGVRLDAEAEVTVVAPHGLDDLFGCVCRHNATRAPADVYVRRVSEKGWRALAEDAVHRSDRGWGSGDDGRVSVSVAAGVVEQPRVFPAQHHQHAAGERVITHESHDLVGDVLHRYRGRHLGSLLG
jgi:uncharacterized protein